MTTLTDLKRAIARVEEYRAMPLHDRLLHGHAFAVAEREAWRLAYEWLAKQIGSHPENVVLDIGMALVREELG